MAEEDSPESPSPEDVARKARDDKIAALYSDPNGPSVSRLAVDFGLSEPSIRKITARLGIKRASGRKGGLTDDEKVCSPLHLKMGVRFTSFLYFDKPRTNAVAAEELGWSPQKVSAIGKGQYELTLTDLSQLAEYMGLSMSDLLKDF